MNGLVEFLRARLADDAADAEARRGVFPAPTVEDNGNVWLHVWPDGQAVVTRYLHPREGYGDMAVLRDWASPTNGWTRERALREVEAKRRMLDELRPLAAEADGIIWSEYSNHHGSEELLLALLALPYSDHPDFREDWRP